MIRCEYEVTDNHVYCILDGEVIGTLNMLNWDTYYEINNVFVKEEYRGQGIAKEMMRKAINYIKSKNCRVEATCSYAKKYLDKEKM